MNSLVVGSKIVIRSADLVVLLDRLAEAVRIFGADTATLSRRLARTRFYAALSKLVLPVAIRKELVMRCCIEPIATVYIHDSIAYLSIVGGRDIVDESFGVPLNEAVPCIQLSGDSPCVYLLAASIASKIVEEGANILGSLPAHLRMLVERALDVYKRASVNAQDLSIKLARFRKVADENRRYIVEVVLWTSKTKALDIPYEILFVKSFGSGHIKLRYVGGYVDIAAYSSTFVDLVLHKVVPYTILKEVESNVLYASKIVATALDLALELNVISDGRL